MVKSNKQSQTFPKVDSLSTRSIDSVETANSCAIIIVNNRHNEKNCTMCFRNLCPKCFRYQELFSSKENENHSCPHCLWYEELKMSILFGLVNTIQLIVFLVIFPFMAFAMAIHRTERVIQEIERRVDNIFIILIVNLILSIPIYLGIYVLCLVVAPFRIIKAYKQAMEERNYEILKQVFSQQ